jgi:hypothetical protein
MNELSPIPRPPIELAFEPPFRLRTLEVTPAALEMRRGDDVTTLEPRVMQVLVALWSGPLGPDRVTQLI